MNRAHLTPTADGADVNAYYSRGLAVSTAEPLCAPRPGSEALTGA